MPLARCALVFIAMFIVSACEESPSPLGDAGGVIADAAVSEDAAIGEDASIEEDAAVIEDASAEVDASVGWINPGCALPENVVDTGLELDLTIDLSRFPTREYLVRERATLHPTSAGEAITLYATALVLGDASAGYAYDGIRATFCTGPFEAGDVVVIDVEYLVSEEVQNFPAGNVAGIHVWENGMRPPVVGTFSSPFFASTWLLAPQTMPWFDDRHDGNVAVERIALEVIAPEASWTVIGPGNAVQDGSRFRFEIDRTMPLYTVAFAAAADYQVVAAGTSSSGVDLSAAILPGSSSSGTLARLEMVARALDWLTRNIAAFPWNEPLTFAEIPGFRGGMEHTAGVWIGTSLIDRPIDGDYVAVHEAIHHWWGNDVRVADWAHFWLDEGLVEWTTIFAAFEEISAEPAFREMQREYRTEAAELSVTAGATIPLRFADDADLPTVLGGHLLFFYRYGAAFLEMIDVRLRNDYGDDLVSALRDWYALNAGAAITTEQFTTFLIDRTGDRDAFTRLFDEWVYRGPSPTLELGGYTYASGIATFDLARIGGAGQTLDPLQIAVLAGNEVHTSTVSLPDAPDAVTVSMTIPSAPSAIVIDPEGRYILRLRAASGWNGPVFSNVLP